MTQTRNSLNIATHVGMWWPVNGESVVNKPQVASGKRIRITYRNEPAYLLIFPDAKEIFISSIDEQDHKTMAGIDAITRLVSLGWQSVGLEKTLNQLKKAKRNDKDLPGIILNVLGETP